MSRAPLLVAIVVALLVPAPAGAHLRAGGVAVDYRASVAPPAPRDRAALSAGIYENDRTLHITVRRGHSIVVYGYLGEPFIRVGASGVAVNTSSPTSVDAGLLKQEQRTTAASVAWRVLSQGRSVAGHDARAQGLPREVERSTWRLPIAIDGTHTPVSRARSGAWRGRRRGPGPGSRLSSSPRSPQARRRRSPGWTVPPPRLVARRDRLARDRRGLPSRRPPP